MQRRPAGALWGLWLMLVGMTGCAADLPRLDGPARLERGLIVILPGIEGNSRWNRDIALGLDQGGVTSAIRIDDWTNGLPGSYVYTLAHLERNQQEARRIAAMIESYRDECPGRPVHLIGHSGGAGMAVLTLEALAEETRIATAFLLAPALSPEYDLSPALRRVHQLVYSFYSEEDVALLKIGTSIFGSIDRQHEAAAGATGFITPAEGDTQTEALYSERLRQVAWGPSLERYGADGTHFGWASLQFARTYLAPIIVHNEAHWSARRVNKIQD
ncbi:MAG: alpha/beta hydrolase [Planctomycetota bacterium]